MYTWRACAVRLGVKGMFHVLAEVQIKHSLIVWMGDGGQPIASMNVIRSHNGVTPAVVPCDLQLV